MLLGRFVLDRFHITCNLTSHKIHHRRVFGDSARSNAAVLVTESDHVGRVERQVPACPAPWMVVCSQLRVHTR